jgi:hypothetical protein
MTPALLLHQWLQARLPAEAAAWLDESGERVRGADGERALYLRIGQVTRRLGSAALQLAAAELAAADAARPAWDPRDWTVDQAARLWLILQTLPADAAAFARRLERLCATGEVGELVAFYRGLPLYPAPERHAARCAEGVRSNMRVVFEAVAHRNPYPSEQLPEGAWNQMVLKALFVGCELQPIVGLDARRNPALAGMLLDYAHERWAASRALSPELWRCVGPYATGATLADFERLLARGSPNERSAAALALAESPDPGARALLERDTTLLAALRAGRLSWHNLTAAP